MEEKGNGHDKSLASATDILEVDDLATSTFEFRGKHYRVRELSGDQAERISRIHQDKDDKRNRLALAVQLALIDGAGKQLFTESDIPKLAKKSMAWLGRVQREILDISGLTPEGTTKLGEGSGRTETGGSSSA